LAGRWPDQKSSIAQVNRKDKSDAAEESVNGAARLVNAAMIDDLKASDPAPDERPPRLPRVAFIDDDADLLAGLRRALRGLNLGWDTSFHSASRPALEALVEAPVDVVVVDIRMPDLSGVEVAAELARRVPKTVCIVLSGSTDFDLAISSINVGRIFRYLLKPCPTPALVAAISAALRSQMETAPASDQGTSAKAAIDLLKCGVIVLGLRGDVLFTNQRAGELLARREGIVVDTTGVCRASSLEDTQNLHKAIRTARDQHLPDAMTIDTGSRGPLRVVVRPCEDDASDTGPCVCLYLFARDDASAVDPRLLRGLFGLTVSESKLAAALASGLSLEVAAQKEGWTLNSAKTYLKTVFNKLGVSRQADLVRVVLRTTGG
jgi:DNA-binding NarL/FixJ family response regulator